jgi:predicted ATP-grasp superfamily ATP-dependent carboligase
MFRSYWRQGCVHRYRGVSKAAFVESLLSIRHRIGPFRLLPIGEDLVRWMSSEREVLIAEGIHVRVPDSDTYGRLSDKGNFLGLCTQYGIRTPAQIGVSLTGPFTVPFVVKPRRHTREPGVLDAPLLVENKLSYEVLRSRQIDERQHFFQEYVHGASIYYCALYANGTKRASFCQKNLAQQPGGKSVLRAVPCDPLPAGLEAKIDAMFRALRYDGVMMLELRQQEADGELYAIECNPRLWGPLQLAVDYGLNFTAPVY